MDLEVGGKTQELYVTSSKEAMGYLIGVSGVLDATFAIKSIVKTIIPPTANLEE